MKNRRIVITRRGTLEVLCEVEDSIPEPSTGEVRIKIIATGVAFADVLMRYGLYPGVPAYPFSPGYDIVGTVDAVGPGSSRFQVGHMVAALTITGGYAQYTNLPESELVSVPADADPAQAVSLVLNYTTAYQMLHRRAKVGQGSRVLIHGAAGGVGTAAMQIGKLAGATLYGTASPGKHELLRQFGCTPIDYRNQDFVEVLRGAAPDGMHLVLDPIGGCNWWRSYQTLRKGGMMIGYGISAALSRHRPNKLVGAASFALLGALGMIPDGKRAEWYSITAEKKRHPSWFHEDLAILMGLLVGKKINPVVSHALPLGEARRAHELLETAALKGKIVLMCQQ